MNSSKDTLPSMPASVSAAAAMTRATSSMQKATTASEKDGRYLDHCSFLNNVA